MENSFRVLFDKSWSLVYILGINWKTNENMNLCEIMPKVNFAPIDQMWSQLNVYIQSFSLCLNKIEIKTFL